LFAPIYKILGHPHSTPQPQYPSGILICNQHMPLNNHFLPENNLLSDLFALLDHNSMITFRPSNTSQAEAATIPQYAR